MKDVSTVISDENINMTGVNVGVSKNLAIFDLTLEVRDIAELSRVLDRLENLPNVLEAKRVRPG
jgi:GTP pyrophosphokinase